MFGFGWVRTHLGVVFGDVYGFFWVFELDFWKNGPNEQNLGNCGGPTPRRSDPTQRRRPTPRRGMPTPRCGRVGGRSSLEYAAA